MKIDSLKDSAGAFVGYTRSLPEWPNGKSCPFCKRLFIPGMKKCSCRRFV